MSDPTLGKHSIINQLIARCPTDADNVDKKAQELQCVLQTSDKTQTSIYDKGQTTIVKTISLYLTSTSQDQGMKG
ncbi:hypothetical protein BPOR_0540g00030 [Botrytis porri]|uniref:Uncharacterized protein n=1 Tax=Botrytis porri TaxID=87229 RepID=A0A4Z1KEX0_9HELO|nr:hypothetical protein BPOR_0540g00030 [Botrytis porri]